MNEEFFVVSLPGLEDVVLSELNEWYPNLGTKVEHGGITVMAPAEVGLTFNLTLKTPTRILLRLARFRCRDFPKLHRVVSALPWSRYLEPSAQVRVHAASRGSRVKIKARIEDTCFKAWDAYRLRAKARADGPEIDLYVRLHDDECVVSLDTSGERLHKRGVRKLVGEAPLRETIAAALLRVTYAHAAGATSIEVVDPMAGSGTFLLEAATSHEVTTARDFAHLKLSPGVPPTRTGPPILSLIGFERDAATLKAARENLRGLTVDLRAQDVFTAEPLPPAAGARWVMVNPPYGARLKIKEPLPEYYARLFAAIEHVAKPDLTCALLPADGVKGRLKLPTGWRVVEKRPFLNGGLPVIALVFGRLP